MTDPHPADVVELWLQRARSDLQLGEAALNIPGVMLEDACFHAQQCAEKALKGLLSQRRIDFPRTHAIEVLLDLLKNSGLDIPLIVDEADILTHMRLRPAIQESKSQSTGVRQKEPYTFPVKCSDGLRENSRSRSMLLNDLAGRIISIGSG